MLFNSISFLCFFLPVTLLFFFVFGRAHQQLAMVWICVCSLIFYSWLGIEFLLLLVVSILFNYSIGRVLDEMTTRERLASWVLIFGVGVNLLVLVYYKYLFDLTGWLHEHRLPRAVQFGSAILPLGISFFTFTQIGFLVDRKAGITKAKNFIEYVVFVTFFPHLIAGPILHHREIMPQFLKSDTYRFNVANFTVGLCIFTVGFAKKVLIADRFSGFVPLAFDQTYDLSRMEAWRCILSYFIQLYFDFSGYSEMALGLARMFNVTFPANFDSPYKAPNVIEFWQRWHMSLTRYVSLYVYNPIALAITRARYAKGKLANRAALRTPDGFAAMVILPTMITMILIGVWHGSGQQFLVFGLLHGFYLCVAHAWRLIWDKKSSKSGSVVLKRGRTALSILLTCVAVLFAQVFFRAHSVGDADRIIGAMTFWPAESHAYLSVFAPLASSAYHLTLVGPKGIAQALSDLRQHHLGSWGEIILALLFIWTMPNTLQIFAAESPALLKSRAQPALIPIRWHATPFTGVCLGLLFLYTFMYVTGTTEFLYFRF